MKPAANKPLTMAGVCTGIGGFDLAAERCGYRLLWGCEIDAACRKVLEFRFPQLPIFKNMLSDELLAADSPDVLAGGTPCQGFSLAGLRKGLADDRSNLALRFIQLADRHQPTVVLWENVDGVINMPDNAFGCFLAGLVGADAPLLPPEESGGRWTNAGVAAGPVRTAAWRVLDSQYFGVAQRRNRVFVVASPRADLPFQILFEPEGLRRHSPPSREAREDITGPLGSSSPGGGVRTTDLDGSGAFIAYGGNNTQGPIEVATALRAKGGTGHGDFESETFVATVGTLGCNAGPNSNDAGNFSCNQGVDAGHILPVLCGALKAEGFDGMPDGTGRGMPIIPIAYRTNAAGQVDAQGDKAAALTSSTDPCSQIIVGPAVAFTERTRAEGRTFECQKELAYALTNPGAGGRSHSRSIFQGYAVRRLTPIECERLQGFPDLWTFVLNGKNKPMADGSRYRQLGNAVTIPVVQWLLKRIYAAVSDNNG